MPSNSSSLKCQTLLEYISSLEPSLIDKLYCHSSSCLAVFRELPVIGKHYVMRLLFVEQPIPQAVVASWLKSVTKHSEASQILSDINVWKASQMPSGLSGWLLNHVFRSNLKVALMGGGERWSVGKTHSVDKHAPDIEYLDTYAMKKRWESVLHFMVGHKQQSDGEGISADTIKVLAHASLIKIEDNTNDSTPVITANGFQFLLMDTSSQIWYFLVQYLQTVESRGLNLVECLTFLFQLSFLTLGKDYSTEGLTESNLIFLQNLREFGLIYQRKRKGGRFYPTRLAVNLLNSQKDSKLDMQRSGSIVVETNFRVYAYTESPLQIALIALFTEMQYRFPKFVLGVLTRESVRQAFKSGITAKQIVNFLSLHSHSVMANQSPIIPGTVIDQITLWEKERDRFLFKDGVLYSQFNSQPDFELLRKYANDLGVLIWDNPSRRVMVVSHDGHDEVRRFFEK